MMPSLSPLSSLASQLSRSEIQLFLLFLLFLARYIHVLVKFVLSFTIGCINGKLDLGDREMYSYV